MRTSLIPPCKRVRIENRGTVLNQTHKIHKGKTLKSNTFGFAGMLQGVLDLRKK